MSKTNSIKILIPEGHVVDFFNTETGEIKFKLAPVSFMEQLKSCPDEKSRLACLFAFHGTTQEKFIAECDAAKLPSDEIGNRLEKMIVAAYNGWKLPEDNDKLPDWGDGTAKFYPWFNMPSPSGSRFSFSDYADWYSYSVVGSHLVFCGPNAKAHLLDAVDKFLPQYEQSRTT